MDFAVSTDHGVKLKETEKRLKYQDLVGELKNPWNMKVTVIPVVNGALGTITKRLVQGLVLELGDLEITKLQYY